VVLSLNTPNPTVRSEWTTNPILLDSFNVSVSLCSRTTTHCPLISRPGHHACLTPAAQSCNARLIAPSFHWSFVLRIKAETDHATTEGHKFIFMCTLLDVVMARWQFYISSWIIRFISHLVDCPWQVAIPSLSLEIPSLLGKRRLLALFTRVHHPTLSRASRIQSTPSHLFHQWEPSLVGIATRLRTGRSGARIPVETSEFSLLQNVQIGFGPHPASYSVGTGVLSRR
jgi:hypothetical protein